MKKIYSIIMILILFLICGCSNNKSIVANTTWKMSGGSEVIFTNDQIMWYQSPSDHTKNYYAGKYKFYIGKDAVNYIVNDLSEYGVTKDELQNLFDRNEEYSVDNFVVFDIRYNEFDLDGEKQKIERPLVPWFGFILDNNTYLDVANMNTSTYYKMTKQN